MYNRQSEKYTHTARPIRTTTKTASVHDHQKQRFIKRKPEDPCGSTETYSGNYQETKTCMIRACHTPRQPLQNHTSGHLGGWATPWSAEEMPDGHHRFNGHSCPRQNCSQELPAEKAGRRSLLNCLSRPPGDPLGQGTAELNWTKNWNYTGYNLLW